MEEKKITVRYFPEGLRVRIDATMRKQYAGWYCIQVHAVQIDNLVFDFETDGDDLYDEACQFLGEDPFDVVEARHLDDNSTELIPGHKFDPWVDAGVSHKDFLWSSQD